MLFLGILFISCIVILLIMWFSNFTIIKSKRFNLRKKIQQDKHQIKLIEEKQQINNKKYKLNNFNDQFILNGKPFKNT